MSPRSPAFLLFVLALLGMGLVVLVRPWERGSRDPVPQQEPLQAPGTAAEEDPPAPREATGGADRAETRPAPAPVRNPPAPQRMVHFPDGTYLPPLNGVQEPAKMQWPPDAPWAPVVGIRTDALGNDWYVHADGRLSTTQMVYRSDLGRPGPITRVASPTKPMPMEGVDR